MEEIETNTNKKLLEWVPIGILIKNIDSKDTEINRKKIYNLWEDNHNDELRYSRKNILKYIPCFNKMFILKRL